MIKKLLLFNAMLLLYSCSWKNCSELPETFASYNDAAEKIANTSFMLSESINTSKSSWIRNAKYKSCDGKTGFLLIKTDQKEYIHKGVPLEIWKDFKNSDSYGSFYSGSIKGSYQLYLKN